jgi:hypothetical protein
LVGEPILLPHDGRTFSRDHSLVPLDGDRVGLVYRSNSEARTRILDQAFSAWPPLVGDAIVISDGFQGGPPVVLSSLPSGLFTLRSLGYLSETGVYAFGEAGAVRNGEVFWNMFLYPGPETPFDVVKYDDTGYQLLGFASLDAPDETLTQTVGDHSCALGFLAATGETSSVIAALSVAPCDPKVELYRRGSNGLEQTATLPLAVHAQENWLAPRPGGFWYFLSDWMEGGTYAHALDEAGVPIGEPWHDPYTFGDFTPNLRSWRDGFLGGHSDASGVSLFVSDGFHRTDMGVIPGTEPALSIASKTKLAVVVGGPDSGSFLMAYATSPGVLLARAECVTPL